MSLSRTARILIALLLVAAAAFFWVNYFTQSEPPTTLATQPAPTPGVAVPGAAAADAAASSPTATGEAAAAQGTGAATGEGTGAAAGEGAGAAPSGAAPAGAPPVVAPPTVVLRDLVVDELPFLVTSPPVATTPEAEAEAGGANRPEAGRRGNINPFSPVIVQAPEPEQTFTEVADVPPVQEPDVVIVSDGTPPAGQAAQAGSAGAARASVPAQPVLAPAPRALAPAAGRVGELPRPLPSGTLPITPDILRDARAATPTPLVSAPVAAVLAPEEPQAPAELPQAGEEAVAGSGAPVEVLGPGQPTEASVTSKPPVLPLVVGADALSRYLRDNDVRFTGTALGPLSVGVFRAKNYEQPVVLTLGQSLPDTEIVLADLRGYEAKFSLGNNTQVLSLDLRR